MSDQFAVFGSDGRLMGNLTSSFGIPAAPEFPSVPTTPAFPNYPGNTLASVAPAISTGITGATPASNAPAGVSTGTPTSAGGTDKSGLLASYFTRTVVIVLGFIFVAVGLTMFGTGQSAGQIARRVSPL